MVAGRGDTGISSEHFLYNENNLTHCSTQRNSPPIPQSSPPPPPLHYHIKAWVQSKSSLSRVGARHTVGEGKGRDQGSESRPKPEFAFILLQCVYVQKMLCICESVDTSAWLLVGGGAVAKNQYSYQSTNWVFYQHWGEVNSNSRDYT